MRNLRELRFRLRIATAVIGGLCLIAAGLLIFLYSGTARQADAFQALHSQVQNRRSAMVPPQTVEDRVKEARGQIGKFYEDRFPTTSSAIFEQLGKLANDNKVRLNQATYETDESDVPGIEQVNISASLIGDYSQTMKFINALERDKMFFIVDTVALGDQSGGGAVRLNIRLETYMKGGV